MDKINVLTLVGGISRGSINQKYFRSLKELDPKDFEFVAFDISKLPFFSQDLENDPLDIVTEFKEKIREADAVLFITPEYNRSIPGVLKNAVDWGSRPYGMNLWEKKPAGILGASFDNIGTFGAQHHLRQVLAYLDMYVVGQPEVYFKATEAFDNEGKLKEKSTRQLLLNFFDAFRDLIGKVSKSGMYASARTFKAQGLEDSPTAQQIEILGRFTMAKGS